jgi:hypothetical protein
VGCTEKASLGRQHCPIGPSYGFGAGFDNSGFVHDRDFSLGSQRDQHFFEKILDNGRIVASETKEASSGKVEPFPVTAGATKAQPRGASEAR